MGTPGSDLGFVTRKDSPNKRPVSIDPSGFQQWHDDGEPEVSDGGGGGFILVMLLLALSALMWWLV